MTVQRKKIVVYADGEAAIYSMMKSLQETFSGSPVDIVAVRKNDFFQDDCLTDDTICFILPGTPGGSSSYRDQLGQAGFDKIRDYLARGGCYIGGCAGAYLAARSFEYFNKMTGETRKINSPLPLFSGRALGPIEKFVDLKEKENPWANYSVVRLAFRDAAGHMREGRVCYSQGPWLEIDPGMESDHEVIARYKDIEGMPVAIAARNIGKGRAVFVGVVPEIGGESMFQQINHKSPYGKDGQRFAEELFRHEEGRHAIWTRVMSEITRNAERNGRLKSGAVDLPKSPSLSKTPGPLP